MLFLLFLNSLTLQIDLHFIVQKGLHFGLHFPVQIDDLR